MRLLDSIPQGLQTDRSKKLRVEAAENQIKEMRTRVRDLYTKSRQVTGAQRLDVLLQCQQQLRNALQIYPNTLVKGQIERSLRNIDYEVIEMQKKGQK